MSSSSSSSASRGAQAGPAVIAIGVVIVAVIIYVIYHFTLGATPTLNADTIPAYMKGKATAGGTAGATGSPAVTGPQNAPYGPTNHPGGGGGSMAARMQALHGH